MQKLQQQLQQSNQMNNEKISHRLKIGLTASLDWIWSSQMSAPSLRSLPAGPAFTIQDHTSTISSHC